MNSILLILSLERRTWPYLLKNSVRSLVARQASSEERLSFVGKVVALVYDRFGDFDGFTLDTEDGDRSFHAREPALERLIQPTGFFRSKARSIQGACAELVEKYGGEVPRTMEQLTALPGVGRKTANVVLGNAFGINAGIVVDTHVQRLSRRLGLTRHDDAVNTRRRVRS